MKNKKGLSPVITTVLLVLLAIVLAGIIFLWAKGFIKERLTKFDGSEERPAEEVCGLVKLSASVSNDKLSILNNGDIAVYKVGIRRTSFFGSKIEEREINSLPGSAQTFEDLEDLGSISKIIPILLAKKKDGSVHEFFCPESFWVSVS